MSKSKYECLNTDLENVYLPCCCLWCEDFKKTSTKFMLKRVFEDDDEECTAEIKAKVIFSN